ncbi:MAG TPA: hypothetical protein VFJ82_03065 [Longimicrobium sp.]|nr:hypothetical protein [Longimicrobium sp.]
MSGFTRTTTDGFEVYFWGTSIWGMFPKVNGASEFRHDFAGYPFAAAAITYLSREAPKTAAGTLVQRLNKVKIHARFVRSSGHTDLTPETFVHYLRFLTDLVDRGQTLTGQYKNFGEGTAAESARTLLHVYKTGLDSVPGWNTAHLHRMQKALGRSFRGAWMKIRRRAIKRATPLATFTQLADAAVRELRSAEAWLAGGNSLFGTQYRRPEEPFALLAVALIMVLRYGIRAEEFNQLNEADVEESPHGHHVIHLHAPNKSHRVLLVDDAFLKVLAVARKWSAAARALDPDGAGDALFVIRLSHTEDRAPVCARYTTTKINGQLRAFYRKWHNVLVRSADGRAEPVLHTPGDPETPYWGAFKSLRRAYTVHKANRLKGNIAVLQELLGHRSITTTLRHYTLLHESDYADEVAHAMGPEAKLLAAGLKHRVALGVVTDPAIGATNRETPVGLCTSERCTRSGSCLGCSFAVVLTSRRENVLASREDALQRARKQFDHGDSRGAENLLRKAALAQATLDEIDRVTGAAE